MKKQAPKKTAKTGKLNPTTFRKLNFVMAFLYFVQAVAILVASSPSKGSFAITASFLNRDNMASEAQGQAVYVAATHRVFDLKMAYVLAAVALVGAVVCLLMATRYRQKYEADLKVRVNRFRWFHYAAGGSLTLVALGLVLGVFDISSLLMIIVFGITASLLAWRVEAKTGGRLLIGLCVLTALAPVVVLAIYLKDALVYGVGLPSYMYVLAGSMLALFVLVSLVAWMTCTGRRWFSNYLSGELAYSILGFVTVTALIWQIFAGMLRR